MALLAAVLVVGGVGGALRTQTLGWDPVTGDSVGTTVGSTRNGAGGDAASRGSGGRTSPAGSAAPTTTAPAASPASSSVAPGTPRSTPSPSRGVSRVQRLENEVTSLVNQERAKGGCGAVRTDERLRSAARSHSADMARNDYFSHTGQDGSSPWDRAERAGYERAVGENIAYGYRTAAEVMRGWMHSPGHRANILNCEARAVGVGLAYSTGGTAYWTQLFGSV